MCNNKKVLWTQHYSEKKIILQVLLHCYVQRTYFEVLKGVY